MNPKPKEISSLDHPFIKELVSIRKEKNRRQELGLCLIEGRKTVEDVAERRSLTHLLATSLENLNLKAREHFLVTERVMEKISGCVSPDGIVATTSLPLPSSLDGLRWILALDQVQDPGNLGTLVRTALGLGFEGLFLIQGSCDLFHEKVLRATKGASLFLPHHEGNVQDLLALQRKLSLPLFSGDLNGSLPKKVDGAILVLGNEGQGISTMLKTAASPLTIPLEGRIDSLNVATAGALLMSKLKGIL